jgi:hypothetical protein
MRQNLLPGHPASDLIFDVFIQKRSRNNPTATKLATWELPSYEQAPDRTLVYSKHLSNFVRSEKLLGVDLTCSFRPSLLFHVPRALTPFSIMA